MEEALNLYLIASLISFIFYWALLLGDKEYHGPENITEYFTHLVASIVWNLLWPLMILIFILSWEEAHDKS